MEIFDKHYFSLNKTLLSSAGLWPYESKLKKFCIRSIINIIYGAIIIFPQLVRVHRYLGVDMDKVLFHLACIFYITSIYIKFLTSIFYEKELRVLYDNIAKNWQAITDEDELKILEQYSERGWFLTICYILYMAIGCSSYSLLPMVPILLDVVNPLNETRARYHLIDGEYFIVDNVEDYGKVYAFELIPAFISGWLLCSVDPMYSASIEHCLGLIGIVRLRLQRCTQSSCDDQKDESYERIVQLIRLHLDVLNFTDILESTYSSIFFLLLGNNLIFLSIECIIVLTTFGRGDPMNIIRYTMIMVGIVVHLFYISWPGQKLIDASLGLFQDAYLNEWYTCSTRAQKLLCLMTLRCTNPCQLTAGGLYVMNFTNFATIMKTSMSYMTVISSFR